MLSSILCYLQLIDVQSHHPINYVPFIKPALELVAQFLFTDDGSCKSFGPIPILTPPPH